MNQKVILLGASGVGKTSICTRIVNDVFIKDHYPTVGVDFYKTNVSDSAGRAYSIALHDTAGQEEFAKIVSSFFRKTQIVLLIFSVTQGNTFNRCKDQFKDFVEVIDNEYRMILLGNKIDLIESDQGLREVTYEDAHKWAQDNKGQYYEVSARTGYGIEETKQMIADYLTEMSKPSLVSNSNIDNSQIVDVNNSSHNNNSHCCS